MNSKTKVESIQASIQAEINAALLRGRSEGMRDTSRNQAVAALASALHFYGQDEWADFLADVLAEVLGENAFEPAPIVRDLVAKVIERSDAIEARAKVFDQNYSRLCEVLKDLSPEDRRFVEFVTGY